MDVPTLLTVMPCRESHNQRLLNVYGSKSKKYKHPGIWIGIGLSQIAGVYFVFGLKVPQQKLCSSDKGQ